MGKFTITISEEDVSYLQNRLNQLNIPFLRLYYELPDDKKKELLTDFYIRMLKNLIASRVPYVIKYSEKQRTIQISKNVNVKFIDLVTCFNGNVFEYTKPVSFGTVLIILDKFELNDNKLSFILTIPDLKNVVHEKVVIWCCNKNVEDEPKYYLVNPDEIDSNYLTSLIASINFDHYYGFNMVKNGFEDSLIDNFIDFLYRKRLSLVGSETISDLKKINKSAEKYFPDYARLTEESKLKILYNTTCAAMKWCDYASMPCNIHILAKSFIRDLWNKELLNRLVRFKEHYTLERFKSYPNGELMWLSYMPDHAVCKKGSFYHASDLWNLIVDIF